MNLKEAIDAGRRPTGGICSFVALMASLSPADLKVLTDCLADPWYTDAQIARGLTDEGHRFTRTTVQRHRAGDCRCGTR